MKANKLTAGSNLMWESSRMMLPEHVAALNEQKRESMKKARPELDEQAFLEIFYSIDEAYNSQSLVKVIIFDDYEDREYIGVITKVDQQLKKIKLEQDEDQYEWVQVENILEIHL